MPPNSAGVHIDLRNYLYFVPRHMISKHEIFAQKSIVCTPKPRTIMATMGNDVL